MKWGCSKRPWRILLVNNQSGENTLLIKKLMIRNQTIDMFVRSNVSGWHHTQLQGGGTKVMCHSSMHQSHFRNMLAWQVTSTNCLRTFKHLELKNQRNLKTTATMVSLLMRKRTRRRMKKRKGFPCISAGSGRCWRPSPSRQQGPCWWSRPGSSGSLQCI